MTGEVAATLKASGKGGGRTNDLEATYVALAENQRGELVESEVTQALSRGGGQAGSGVSSRA